MEKYTLKPNLKKVFLSNFLGVVLIAGLIIFIVFMLDYVVGLDIFIESLEMFNVHIDSSQIIGNFILTVLGLAFLMSLVNLLLLKGIKYEFYNDKTKISKSAFFILINSVEIFYKDIFRVSYNKDGFFNKIFNSGVVVLEYSNKKDVKLEFIDNPEQISSYVQKLVNRCKQMEQARFTEEHKVQKIVDQL